MIKGDKWIFLGREFLNIGATAKKAQFHIAIHLASDGRGTCIQASKDDHSALVSSSGGGS